MWTNTIKEIPYNVQLYPIKLNMPYTSEGLYTIYNPWDKIIAVNGLFVSCVSSWGQ